MGSAEQPVTPVSLDEELAKDSYLLSSLLEHSDSRIYFKNLDSRFVRINQAQAAWFGLAEPGDAVGKSDRDFFGTKHANKARRDELKIIRSGQPFIDIEEREEWPDGRVTWASTSKMPLFNAKGQCIGTFGSSRDITRRKEAEDAYRQVFENNPVPMYVLESKTLRFIAVNEAMVREYGYTQQEFLAKTVVELHLEEDISTVLLDIKIKKHDLGPQNRGIWKQRKKSGEVIDVGFICQRLELWGDDSVLISVNDISERKRAEEAVRQAEEKYREIFENAPEGIFRTSPEGKSLALNPAGAKLLGYASAEAGVSAIKDSAHDVWLNPQDRDRYVELLEKQGEINDYPCQFRRLDGTTIWLALTASKVSGPDGKTLYYQGFMQNLTERRAAEEAAYLAEEKYRSIFENAVLGIFQSTPSGKFLHINPALAHMHGYDSPDEMLKALAHEGSRLLVKPSVFLELVRRAEEDNRVHSAELEVYCKDGSTKWVRQNIRVLRDVQGNIVFREGTVEDITERRRNEELMHRLSQVVEQSPISIVITDLSGDTIYVNRRFTEISGYTAEEAIGKNPRILKSGFSTPEVYRQLWETITAGEEWHGVFHNRKKNGDLYWESAVIRPIKDADGIMTHFLAMKEDITEKLEMESQLRQSQKLEAIGQLAAGIAHEINTPIQYVGDNTNFFKESWNHIANLLVAAQKLRNQVNSEMVPVSTLEEFDHYNRDADVEYLSQDIPRAIDQTLEGVQRVTRIVRAMKEFSHPGSEEKRAIDLNRAIETTLTISNNEWKYVAKMNMNLDPNLPLVPCLAGEINQVLLNLVVNGAHAIEDVMSVSGSMGTITIATRRDDGWVEVSVADTGTGIPENIRERVFDPFFTTKQVGKGTGQGLMLAHTVVVKKHGGKIWFDSEIGKGTTFYVRLPLSVVSEE